VEIDGRGGAMDRGGKGNVGGGTSRESKWAEWDAKWVFAGIEERNELVRVNEWADVKREVAPEELKEKREGGLGDREAESPSETVEGGVSKIEGRLVNREPEESEERELSRGENVFGEVQPRGVTSL
jgi:hypothetical protein